MNLPKAVHTPLGPLPIDELPVEHRGEYLGRFLPTERVIEMHPDLVPATMWQTFWHEVVHVGISDAGVQHHLSKEHIEAVCDALGSFFGAMTLAGCLTIKAPRS